MAKVYLDSCMVIGLIEGDSAQRALLKQQIPKHRIFSSELVRMDARILPLRQDNYVDLNLLINFSILVKV